MSGRIRFEAELNPEQYEAVTTVEGPVLIIAGAGSGKTRVITYRIAYMLERGVPQSAVLALTFTNKAAREMSHRVKELTGRKLKNLTVSTFHAFGVEVLRTYADRLGYRHNFSIYDESDRYQLLKDSAREAGFNLASFDPRKAGAAISDAKTGRAGWAESGDAWQTLFVEYQSSLKAYNAVDFDDLIGLPIELMEKHPEVRDELRSRYRYIMVDEFQDTSMQQYAMMHLLSTGNVCVVGDDDQSIYSWRGANYENIRQFERDYPSFKEIKLERNYRSTTTILDAANTLIRNNPDRKDKALWSPSGTGGELISFESPENEVEEAASIARTIKELKLKERVPNEEFGILIRTNNLVKHLEEALLAANIPYRVSGGTSFFQRKEIKDVISYLRVAANPDDDVNLLRVINVPRRGIGKKTLETLHGIARAADCSVFEAIKTVCREGHGIPSKTIADMEEFAAFVESLREDLLGKRHIAPRVRAMVDAIDYWGYLVSENQHNEKAAKWKFLNVESLLDSIHQWERDPDTLEPGLYQWLNRITLITRDDDSSEDGESKVNLMTIHAAKGLEFDVVFIAGCEDGIIPHARSLEEGEGNVAEERRLFYVAITRAKKRLYVSACRRRRKMSHVVDCVPSPFLMELPRELIEEREESELTPEESEDAFTRMRAKFAPVKRGEA